MIIAMSFSIKYLNNASQNLGKLNDEIEQNIIDENWDKAYETSIEFTDKWEDYSKKIQTHDQIMGLCR